MFTFRFGGSNCRLSIISLDYLSHICCFFIALESPTPLMRWTCDSCEPWVEPLPIDCEDRKFESIVVLVQRFKMLFVASLDELILLNYFCVYSPRFRTHFWLFSTCFLALRKFCKHSRPCFRYCPFRNASSVSVRVFGCTTLLLFPSSPLT